MISEVINKQLSSKRCLPKLLCQNNDGITDPVRVAANFDNFFINVCPKLAKNNQKQQPHLKGNMDKSFLSCQWQKMK